MRHFKWSKENEVFISQIDAEHRGIFEIAEAFERTVKAGAPLAETRRHLHDLATHVDDHFSHEEWLMQSVAYPSYAWHKQQHETARRRLNLFTPLIEAGDSEAIELFIEFLAGWLHDHTTVTDRMMAANVRNYERSHAAGGLERWQGPSRQEVPANTQGPLPKTLRFCSACGDQSPHEIRTGGLVCMRCAERAVSADLDRD